MHGSPDLTYGDFIIVQSVWGMTQGMAFPLHGLVTKASQYLYRVTTQNGKKPPIGLVQTVPANGGPLL